MTPSPRCSVVVCTTGRPASLERCLQSLRELAHDDFEIVVVDNSPGDERTRELTEAAGARYVREPTAGLSRARNTGARTAKGVVVAYIDDDGIADPSWLSAIERAFGQEDVAACTGRVREWPLGARAMRGWWDLGSEPFRVDRSSSQWVQRAAFGGVGVGGNMAFRRSMFETGWGFDERIGLPFALLGEEHLAFYSLLRDGHAIRYEPDAVVHHETKDPDQQRRRVLDSVGAFALLLVLEEPDARLPTLRLALRGLMGRRSPWRPGSSADHGAGARLGSSKQLAGAVARGPFVYLRWRRRLRPPSRHTQPR